MAIQRMLGGAAAILVAGGTAAAQPKPEQILAQAPIQPGVIVTTPAPADLPGCKATEVSWPGNPAKGVVVTDAAGKKLRQFISSNGDGKYNLFSYYADGVESYREIITSKGTVPGKPDQFRWLGVNGSRWGLDANGDGLIDQWLVISPEELSQELFAAVIGRDQRRLAALTVKAEDLKALALPESEAMKILARAQGAPAKLAAAAQGLALTDKARLLHTTFTAPQLTTADALGSKDDLVRHKGGSILLEKGADDKNAQLMAVGDIVLIGRAWKIVDGPTVGGPVPDQEENVAVGSGAIPPKIKALVDKLIPLKPVSNTPQGIAAFQIERALILEECVAKTEGAEQFPWLKQLIDAYQSAVETDPTQVKALERLGQWKTSILTNPANEIHPYVVFRHLAAESAVKYKEAKDADKPKVQLAQREALEKFVKDYPTAADAPEAIMRLAVAQEYAGKDGEAASKTWYERMTKEFPKHPYAAKATGAVKRLNSEGQPFALAGTTFDGKAFTAANLAGKPAVVFYWASWGPGTLDELKGLAALANGNAAMKGLQIVTVNLDDVSSKPAAEAMLKQANLAGIHLYAEGGLDASPLAVAYGIQMVPHIFLIDAAGKVANRNAQNGALLKDDIEKMLK